MVKLAQFNKLIVKARFKNLPSTLHFLNFLPNTLNIRQSVKTSSNVVTLLFAHISITLSGGGQGVCMIVFNSDDQSLHLVEEPTR